MGMPAASHRAANACERNKEKKGKCVIAVEPQPISKDSQRAADSILPQSAAREPLC
jgi:hypothetical protein